MRRFDLFARFMRFRTELGVLWRAFMAPGTPLHLKVLMLLVPLYLISPIDLLPDFIPIVGWLDDVIIVPMLVSWIFGLVQRAQTASSSSRNSSDSTTIDGTWRRY